MKFKKMGSLVSYQRNVAQVKKPKESILPETPSRRTVTVSQMAVLLYHFFVGVNDPNIYYMDADDTAEKFQARINSEVEVSKEDLEKLLYYTTLAYETKTFWHPGKEEYARFIRSFLTPEERYDQLSGLIVESNKNKKGRLI